MKYFNFLLEILALVGIIFTLTGIFMQIFPPKKINSFYGYRTSRSMKNQNNWDFAQKYSAKLLSLIGISLVFISSLNLFFNIGDDVEKILNGVLIIGSVVFLIIKTECKLKGL